MRQDHRFVLTSIFSSSKTRSTTYYCGILELVSTLEHGLRTPPSNATIGHTVLQGSIQA